jgi:hypothetical protein
MFVDAKYVALRKERLEKEAKIMKDVPGWQVGESPYRAYKGFIPPERKLYDN